MGNIVLLFFSHFLFADQCGPKLSDQFQIENVSRISQELFAAHSACQAFKDSPRSIQLFTQCQEASFRKCYPRLNASIDGSKLEELFSKWKGNPIYRMKTPEAHCLQRAKILAKELTESGYQVKIAEIRSASIVGLVNFNHKSPTHFYDYSSELGFDLKDVGSHYVVTIEHDKLGTMVLDPQFMDQPMKIDDYALKLTGQTIDKENSKNIFRTKVSYHEPILIPELNAFKNGNMQFSDPCGWHLNEKHLQEIQTINKTFNFTTASKIPRHLIGRNPNEIVPIIQGETLRRHEENILEQLSNNRARIGKLEAGILPGAFGGPDININDPSFADYRNTLNAQIKTNLMSARRYQTKIEERLKDIREVIKHTNLYNPTTARTKN